MEPQLRGQQREVPFLSHGIRRCENANSRVGPFTEVLNPKQRHGFVGVGQPKMLVAAEVVKITPHSVGMCACPGLR